MASTGDSFSCANGSLISTDETSPTSMRALSGTSNPQSCAILGALCPTILALTEPLMSIVARTLSVCSALRKYAPRYSISFLTASYTSDITIMDCSDAQITPLSNDLL